MLVTLKDQRVTENFPFCRIMLFSIPLEHLVACHLDSPNLVTKVLSLLDQREAWEQTLRFSYQS